MDTNGRYLATILEVFSDSADSARFLPSDSVWFLANLLA